MIKTKTNDIWQIVRGISILSVVLIHCETAMGPEYSEAERIYYLFFRNLISFPVPAFFFMSGYFLNMSGSIVGFYKKRFPRLIVPYIVYSCAYMVLSCLAGVNFSAWDIVKKILIGGAATPFYYIIVLLCFTIVSPYLYKCVSDSRSSCLIMLISPIILIASYIALAAGVDWWVYLKYSAIWLSFYYGGMLVRMYRPKIVLSHAIVLFFVSFFMQILESVVLLKNLYFSVAYSQMRVSSFLYSASVIMIAYCYSEKETKNTLLGKALIKIGDNSYPLFYMHSLGLIICNVFFSRMGISFPLPLAHIIQASVSLAVSAILIILIRVIIKSRSFRMVLGV